jgi:O-antigen ligase
VSGDRELGEIPGVNERRIPWSTISTERLLHLALSAACLVTLVSGMVGLTARDPAHFGLLLFLGAVGLLGVVLGLRDPVVACTYLLIATFFRLAIPSGTLPVDPFLLAFGGVVVATWLRMAPRWRRLSARQIDPMVCVVILYVSWNVLSMVLVHTYAPGAARNPEPFSVPRFIIIGIVMPLALFLVGRWVFTTERAIRVLLWSIVGAAAYSAAVSILQFTAPALVWPSYIISNTSWPGRAVGIFNQPVVNGLVLTVGFLVATLIASHAAESRLLRSAALLVACASACGVYLTHTRAAWLSFALVVALGAVTARGYRRGYLITLGVMVLAIATNWTRFTSSDRSAGGVGSANEVQDRLNTIATSVWAFTREPLIGWGIGRFTSVNTYHHQQFSPETPWQRGFGIPSHLDALGVLVELGIVGLALWMTVLLLIFKELLRAARHLPPAGMYGRPLALTGLLCLVAQTTTGLTVDLRFFDFPNIIVMLLAGAAIGWQAAQARRVMTPANAGEPAASLPAATVPR